MPKKINGIPLHELDAREEVKREEGRVSMACKEAIYNVLEAFPKARLVRYPQNHFTIETIGEKRKKRQPRILGRAGSADYAWINARRNT